LNPLPASDAALVFTGERFTPESRGAIWYEHWHRYCLAASLTNGRRVLDAACGEGYGSALLARQAAAVIGVDTDADAIAHAKSRYRQANLTYIQGSVTALPLAPASVDLVISFETVEHLGEQREMLAEFRRVLAADGVLVLSSPNRPVYNESGDVANAFHVRELDRNELKMLLDDPFPNQSWYAQRVLAHSLLWRDRGVADGVSFDVLTDDGPSRAESPAAPMYFVVVCAAADIPLPDLPALSLFDDGELSLWREFARVAGRERRLTWDELDARKIAEDRLRDLVESVNALSTAQHKCATLEQVLGKIQDDYERVLAEVRAELVRTQAAFHREAAIHEETRARLAYRETLPGWLRWPLGVARRRLAVRG
jgi:SAM-dependent methyltransferase